MPEDKNVVRLDGPHEFLPCEETTRVPCPLPTGTPLPKRPHKLTPQETHA
jgi:hypothetical protein